MAKSIYQITTDFLSNKFSKSSSSYKDFSDANSKELFDLIISLVGEDELNSKKDEIKRAIVDFFSSPLVEIFVLFKGLEKIIIRAKAYNDIKAITDALSVEIDTLKDRIDDFLDQEGVYVFPKDTRDKIYKFLDGIENDNKKTELIKATFKERLGLHEKDFVICLADKIVVKLNLLVERDIPKELSEESDFLDPKERRFNGVSPELIKKLINTKLPKEFSKKVAVSEITEQMLADELSLSKVGNEYFIKNFIKYLQNSLVSVISQYMSDVENIIVEGIANYIIREHFDYIMHKVTDRVYALLLDKDKNAEAFVKYYNGETGVTHEGMKFKKPEILDKDGAKWNASTILQILLQKRQGIEAIKNKIEFISGFEQDLKDNIAESQELEKKIVVLREEKDSIEQSEENLHKEMEVYQKQLLEIKLDFNVATEGEKAKLQIKIDQLSSVLKKYSLEDEKLYNRKKVVDAEYQKSEQRFHIIKRDNLMVSKKIEAENIKKNKLLKVQEPVEEKYKAITQAFIKAMILHRNEILK